MKVKINIYSIGVLFFVSELLFFSYMFLVHPSGMSVVWRMQAENEALVEQHNVLCAYVESLKEQIDNWESHSFYKERIAREQLQMVRAGETVYYLT